MIGRGDGLREEPRQRGCPELIGRFPRRGIEGQQELCPQTGRCLGSEFSWTIPSWWISKDRILNSHLGKSSFRRPRWAVKAVTRWRVVVGVGDPFIEKGLTLAEFRAS